MIVRSSDLLSIARAQQKNAPPSLGASQTGLHRAKQTQDVFSPRFAGTPAPQPDSFSMFFPDADFFTAQQPLTAQIELSRHELIKRADQINLELTVVAEAGHFRFGKSTDPANPSASTCTVPLRYDPDRQVFKADLDILPLQAGQHRIDLLIMASSKSDPTLSRLYMQSHDAVAVAANPNAGKASSESGQ